MYLVPVQLISVLASTRGLRPDACAIHWAPVEHLVEQMWDDDPQKRPPCSEILVTLKALATDLKQESPECNLSCRCVVM